MQKFVFDKEIVNNQLTVLNNTLIQQRNSKKTLLTYLEKFSNAMYENFNSENTDTLLSLIAESHSIFECIKSNISKTLELKHFLENIYQSDFLNTIDSEKFTKDFNLLLEDISKTNTNYLNFMNNYEKFITPSLSNTSSTQISNIDSVTNTNNATSNESSYEEISNTNLNTDSVNETNNTTSNENSYEEISNTNLNTDSVNETNNTTSNESSYEEISNTNLNTDSVNETNNTTSNENNDNINSIEENISVIPEEESLFEITQDDSKENTPQFSELQEKSLIINRKLGIAILPYSISDLDELFLDNPEKYSSIQDIIDKEYTVHLKDFENTSISRYKEGFKLAKEKSNYTFSQAANFAKKLLIESEITSLIIASCKNVEELDFYIECLNNNELDNFNYFKIIEK
ncbi:MAG: hypothetical protein IKL55_04940 [Clostridia bacterium]|nr:hypothetical protein [Clostridia bacterium]